MNHQTAYQDFTARFKLLISKNPHLITTTLSNIFTMRLIGNKTHGDLAEIAIPEFVNKFMYDFKSEHVGKKFFRSKEQEEDIEITNELTKEKLNVSLKAYGVGPLQLSTDKNAQMFQQLQKGADEISDKTEVNRCWNELVAADLKNKNVLALIYDEKRKESKRFNILVFNGEIAKQSVVKIRKVIEGRGRIHPVFRFFDSDEDWICEVRYGTGTANALQRGLWVHTNKDENKYFDSLTDGWIDYAHNEILVALFSHALLATAKGHEAALIKLQEDIDEQKRQSKLK
jgi:hypothetical protein